MLITRRKQIWENLTEGHEKVVLTGDQEEAALEEILDQKKCIKQFVLNATRNVKYHSSLQKASLFTAKNVLERKDDFNSKRLGFFFFYLFSIILSKAL
jgi:hypothetical protein